MQKRLPPDDRLCNVDEPRRHKGRREEKTGKKNAILFFSVLPFSVLSVSLWLYALQSADDH